MYHGFVGFKTSNLSLRIEKLERLASPRIGEHVISFSIIISFSGIYSPYEVRNQEPWITNCFVIFWHFFLLLLLHFGFPRNFTTKERGIRSLFVASIRIRNLFCSMRYLTKISIYFPYIILIEIFDRWYGTKFFTANLEKMKLIVFGEHVYLLK